MRAQAALRCAAAMLLVALATADRGILPAYSGFIRVQGGKFVDAACNLFPVTGLNACVAQWHRLIGSLYCTFETSGHQLAASLRTPVAAAEVAV